MRRCLLRGSTFGVCLRPPASLLQSFNRLTLQPFISQPPTNNPQLVLLSVIRQSVFWRRHRHAKETSPFCSPLFLYPPVGHPTRQSDSDRQSGSDPKNQALR